MDGRFQGLQLTHALVNGNPLFFQMEVAVCAALDVLKGNRNRRRLFQRGEKILILFRAAGQFGHSNVRDLPVMGIVGSFQQLFRCAASLRSIVLFGLPAGNVLYLAGGLIFQREAVAGHGLCYLGLCFQLFQWTSPPV